MTKTSNTLTVLSWNVNRRKSAWEDIKRFGADVVLLQEATGSDLPKNPDFSIVEPPTDSWTIHNGGNAHGTAIAVMNPDLVFTALTPVPLGFSSKDTVQSSHPAQFSVVKLPLGNKGTYLASLYGNFQDGFADASMHRAISDLTNIFTSGADVLVAGDINNFRGYTIDGKESSLRRSQAVFERLQMLGLDCIGPFSASGPLQGCPCGDTEKCDHVRTYRHMNKDSSRPFQLDFAFANAGLRERLVSCKALTDQEPELWNLSDHAPIEVVLNL